MANDFVGRVERIEIGLDVAEYLVAVIELLGRMLQRVGQALPGRLVAIQRGLAAACTGVGEVDVSTVLAGQPPVTDVDISAKAAAGLALSQSDTRRVNTTAVAEMLQITESGARDLCRRKTLDSVKDSRGQYWVAVQSIEKHVPRARNRAKD